MPDATGQILHPRALAIGVDWFTSGSGGLDRVFHDLMLALPDAGVASRGLVVGPADVAERTGGQVRAFRGHSRFLPAKLWRIRRSIRAELRYSHYDLVAAHFAMFVAPALDCLRDLPLVAHFHGPWADEAAAEGAGRAVVAAKHAMERQVYRRADRVIVLSQAFATIAAQRYGVPEDRIRQVPGSVDTARFAVADTRHGARAKLGWPQDRRILISVRRLARRMGLDQLISAMPAVARAQPDVLLMIAGRGHMEAALCAQVAALGLSDHVRFLGFLPDDELPLAYRAAELNVIPTLALEGFGLTAAEALAAGTPSIVTPIGALPEVVGPLSADLVFASADPGAMADHLVEALRGALSLPDAAACRAYATGRFAVARAAEAVAGIYRALI